MLFTKTTLDGLVDGSVTATYRRWTVVRPKVGSRFTTRIGVIQVQGITAVDAETLTEADARSAGFADLNALRRWLDRAPRGPRDTRVPARQTVTSEPDSTESGQPGPSSTETSRTRTGQPEGQLYRIDLALAGPDPRVALRADDDLDPAALAALRTKLDRMDAAAERGPWTRAVLRQIAAQPGIVSTVLADDAGEERFYYKSRVRRLKALGLTESLQVGYRLSPRGQAFLAAEQLRPRG